jgi:hypothetical protein
VIGDLTAAWGRKRRAVARLLGSALDKKDRQALFNIVFFSVIALWIAGVLGLVVRVFLAAAFGGV